MSNFRHIVSNAFFPASPGVPFFLILNELLDVSTIETVSIFRFLVSYRIRFSLDINIPGTLYLLIVHVAIFCNRRWGFSGSVSFSACCLN